MTLLSRRPLKPAAALMAALFALALTTASASADESRVLPDQYIVTLKRGQDPALVARGAGIRPTNLYRTVLNGFAANLSPADLERFRVSHGSAIEAIEPDVLDVDNYTQDIYLGDNWGLSRIDQRNLPLDGGYNFTSTGAGVNAYVIDGGIYMAHADFGGRAQFGADFVGDGYVGQDCKGHGTQMASILGGSTYGVAKQVNLFSVRVHNCQGTGEQEWKIAALEWIANNHKKPAIANMSLRTSVTKAMTKAVNGLIGKGVFMSAAAGNKNADACLQSPANVPNAFTVANSTIHDEPRDKSNWGTCVDIYAPGTYITAAKMGGGIATSSGTSQASAMVGGAAARLLQRMPTATPATITSALKQQATAMVIRNNRPNTVNSLLHMPPGS